jgi:hypothetical protein
MPAGEVFVPARITHVHTIDPGEIRLITLTLPETHEVAGVVYPIRDAMRPGNAFLARPIGARTAKLRRRMYTRSNASRTAPRVLETIINHTHDERSDTSIWWQTDEVETLGREGGTIDIRLTLDPESRFLDIAENSARCEARNLRLEPDEEWPTMRYIAIALSTGITPFLGYLRYMQAMDFGRSADRPGCHMTLIASVRHARQLMAHDELLSLQHRFPEHFRYYPVLTREWPVDWPYGKGRIIRVDESCEAERQIDLTRLMSVAPDLESAHLRMCGSVPCRDEIIQGLQQHDIKVASFRSEVW